MEEPNWWNENQPRNKSDEAHFGETDAGFRRVTVLTSMTGFGEARGVLALGNARIELRAVNNRHLKVTMKLPPPLETIEPELDRLVRSMVKRGTLTVSVRLDRPKTAEDYRLNLTALASYRDQLRQLAARDEETARHFVVPWDGLLRLPGVVEDGRAAELGDLSHHEHDGDEAQEASLWNEFQPLCIEALERFQADRRREGSRMATALRELAEAIGTRVEEVVALAPRVADAYRDRLLERSRVWLEQVGVTLEVRDIAREVALFADRCDLTEELARLRAHLVQFHHLVTHPSERDEPCGRALEFLVQEIGREINTLGAKANDLEITRHVLTMKNLLESIRELIQNIE